MRITVRAWYALLCGNLQNSGSLLNVLVVTLKCWVSERFRVLLKLLT